MRFPVLFEKCFLSVSYCCPTQAYFVSDGVPSNNFTFFGHFLRGLGYKMPRMR